MHVKKHNETSAYTGPSSAEEEARELLDLSTQDEETEVEAEQDLDLMRQDAGAHLTAATTQYVVCQPEAEAVIEVVLPHLCRCSWCRSTLHETLALCGAEASHPAYVLLAEAEDWARWAAAGHQAAKSARQFLWAHGVSAVYARDGALWEEWPDGTIRRIGDALDTEASSR
jgi:hypothetical protein